jgi:uncharacterized membrane protein YfhO
VILFVDIREIIPRIISRVLINNLKFSFINHLVFIGMFTLWLLVIKSNSVSCHKDIVLALVAKCCVVLS